MKYHTIKSERFNLRCHGAYATYPVYEHATGEKVANLECYAEMVNNFLHVADKKGVLESPFFPISKRLTCKEQEAIAFRK